MGVERSIKDAQRAWAKSRGLPFDSSGYLRDVGANLWRPLSAEACAGFGRGAGSELARHMKALHSSSALVANFFDYWTLRDKAPLLSALGVDDDSAVSLNFEAQFPTGLGGTPPHLDVALRLSSCAVVAIEGKLTEPLQRSTKGKSKFEPSYFPCSGGLWTQRGLPACQTLAEELHEGQHRFGFLDPGQLLKHALGLATQLGDRFSLYYVYYDCSGERSETHKTEIGHFARLVGHELRFKALTYQDVYGKLRASNQADPEYLEYLGSRYFAQTAHD